MGRKEEEREGKRKEKKEEERKKERRRRNEMKELQKEIYTFIFFGGMCVGWGAVSVF